MPDAAAKMAALPPEVRRRDISDLRDNAQPYLHFSDWRPPESNAPFLTAIEEAIPCSHYQWPQTKHQRGMKRPFGNRKFES